jgi:hypothetical protein
MPFDKLKHPEELWSERRKGVRESLRVITIDELKDILRHHEEEFVADPWRDEFLRLMTVQRHATFYCAVPQQNVTIYYCRDADFGVWVLTGSGMGPLDETGKRIMKEAIESPLSGRKIGENK